jgi:hypothetical protein
MIVAEKSADAYTLREADVELSFRHVGDRWQHFVSVPNHGEWFPLLTSEEGTPADDVPPCPPFQDLRFEQLADEIFEFQLMGQSGTGVYSAAVRFDGGADTIDFDLCARGRSQATPLCTTSRYTLAGNDLLPQVQQRAAAVTSRVCDGRAVDIAPVPIADSPHSECRLTTRQNGRRIDAGCFDISSSGLPGKGFSVRWRYRITWAPIF